MKTSRRHTANTRDDKNSNDSSMCESRSALDWMMCLNSGLRDLTWLTH